ncbi:MAG TPA: site-2 protease family protein, partial [Kofleriaceae bacterium]|nr:site-2 protease family protein [Kofleriaceae bacterium]
ISPASPAGRAGLRTGDVIVSVDGFAIRHYRELRDRIGGIERKTVVYLRSQRVAGLGISLLTPGVAAIVPDLPAAGARTSIGIEPAEMFVARVDADSPAAAAGLRAGDVIDTLDGTPMTSWVILDQRLQAQPDHPFVLGWRRATASGVTAMTAKVTQKRRTITDEYGNRKTRLMFGAHNDDPPGAAEMTPIDRRITYAAEKAVARTGEAIHALSVGLVAIFRGEAPREAVGGPITMYRAASVSGHKGWDAFLLMIALVSVSVGLINLLPVPAVDGGHVVIFLIEAVRKQRLSDRARDRFGIAGLAVVAVITILALSSDIARFLLH